MEISRNKQHAIIMTVIYDELNDYAKGDHSFTRDAGEMMMELCECSYQEVPEFIKKVTLYALSHYGEIRNAFIPLLRNWSWERIPLLTQAILIMTYAQNKIEIVDKKVLIDVAVSLGKTYLEDEQWKFINAILDKIL